MKKLLITLVVLMGCGLVVVLIAQGEGGAEGGGGEGFSTGPSEEERKAEAEDTAKQQLLQEYWEKSGGQPTPSDTGN